MTPNATVQAFIDRWKASGASERANYQLFLSELCELLDLEVNPRAAAIADVVLWIGYLQWHFRTQGHVKRLGNPILREYGNIRRQDAVLAFRKCLPRLDGSGKD